MKYLLITGASGNLGKEIINFLDLMKFQSIFLCGRQERLDFIQVQHPSVIYLPNYNLGDEIKVKNLFEKISLHKDDYLFILHLVGAYQGGKYFWEYSNDEFLDLLNSNIITSYLVAKYSLLKVKEAAGGSIIFISSKISIDYEPKRSIYAISKNALNFLVKVIKQETNEINFTANVIAPNIILTEENKKWVDSKDYDKCTTPEEIARIVEFLFDNFQLMNGNIIVTKR